MPPVSLWPLLRGVTFQTAVFDIKNSDMSMNSATLAEVVYALAGSVFVHGAYHSPWVYECQGG